VHDDEGRTEARERDRYQRRTWYLRQRPANPPGSHEPHNRQALEKPILCGGAAELYVHTATLVARQFGVWDTDAGGGSERNEPQA
jgi:hypothetical protein